MSRSGYTDDCENLELYRATVRRTITGKRGQAFLRELATEMDAMPEKTLIENALIAEDGACCAIGVVCKARGIDINGVDCEDPEAVGGLVGISRSMAAEIEYMNDDDDNYSWSSRERETPANRWARMRIWVEKQLVPAT